MGSEGGNVHLWDMTSTSSQELALSHIVLAGHASNTRPIFSSDGRRLITYDRERIRVWPLDLDELLAIARRAAGRELTVQEKAVLNF